jgi:hypothetical protein
MNQEHLIIDTVALHDFFSDRPNKVGIIKMDIEGSEFEALKGMTNLINSNKNMKIFLEFNPYALNRTGTDVVLFLDYLCSLFSDLYWIDEVNKVNKAVSKSWLIDFAKNKQKGHYINLLYKRNIG